MFRKIGKYRSHNDNVLLASFLTTTAGIVNVASLMAFYVLTTNVTGHMAILSEELNRGHWHQVKIVFLWLFMFALGAFFSSFVTMVLGRKNPRKYNYLVISFEVILLFAVGIYGITVFEGRLKETELLAAVLLFAMGLQNALVTYISNAIVRTTHLTGLFTDLGIDLASWFKPQVDRKEVKKKLNIKFYIMTFYFLGGLIGGYAFVKVGFLTFFLAGGILILALMYDWVKLKFYKTTWVLRKYRQFGDIIPYRSSMSRMSFSTAGGPVTKNYRNKAGFIVFKPTSYETFSNKLENESINPQNQEPMKPNTTSNTAKAVLPVRDVIVNKAGPTGISKIQIVPAGYPEPSVNGKVKHANPSGVSRIEVIHQHQDPNTEAPKPHMETAESLEKEMPSPVVRMKGNSGIKRVQVVPIDTPDPVVENNPVLTIAGPSGGVSKITIVKVIQEPVISENEIARIQSERPARTNIKVGSNGISKVKVVPKDTPDPVPSADHNLNMRKPSGVSNISVTSREESRKPSGVSRFMLEPLMLRADLTVLDALELFEGNEIQCLPVVNNENKLIGMLSVNTLMGKDLSLPVEKIIDREGILAIEDGTALSHAESVLHQYELEALPIVNRNGEVKGLVYK